MLIGPPQKIVKRSSDFWGLPIFTGGSFEVFSQIALPLTNLTSTRRRFCWSEQALEAFEKLKSRFVSAPILINPDPSRQFIVEVDASEVGVGAILSQRSPSDNKVHPCAFFSHRLTPSERNYDIGNKELLAVKLALEEWRHWLEGAGVPFLVWTDHKNLEYIRSAKRINSRQARWALFFGRFNFTISYHPGSKNGKPDALSWIFEVEPGFPSPVPIVPPSRVIAMVTWEVESMVREALDSVTIPARCPEGLLFVPESVRTSILQWGHSSGLACHPGVARTLALIKQRFWWPSVARDAREFVLACARWGRALINPQLGFSDRCLSLRDPGPTSPWTLSQAYPRLVAIPWSSPWLTGSQRRFISFPSPNYPQRGRRLSLSLITSSASMASRLMWFLTGVPNSHPDFGLSSVDYWGRQRAFPPVTIRRLTVSPSGPIRTWRESCVAWRQQSL